jgi:hypothetical protein
MTQVFVSYSHRQGDWVWDRLVPVLKAGGAEVLIDRERFRAGRSVVGQMDAVQGKASRHLLVLSDAYLASDYCRHELERALAADPDFSCGAVIPVKREPCALPATLNGPAPLSGPDPLWLDLADDSRPEPWAKLLAACGADVGTEAPHWLAVRDQVARFLDRGQSVNLVVRGQVQWRALLEHLKAEHLPRLALVNLEKGSTARRRGLIAEILCQLGHRPDLPDEPDDLAELDRVILAGDQSTVCLIHFDQVSDRPHYGADLFAALRYLMMDARRLVLLVESRTPFAALLPRDHPLSEIDIRTVELRGRP